MNKAALGLILIALVCGTAAAVRPLTAAKDVRVGTYNSRAIAVAFTASRFNPVIEKKKELDAANKAGDKAKVAELMAWGEDYQRRLHFKGFARVPVDDLLEPVKAGMTEVARAQRLDLIAESCDHVGDRVETVDVTDALVALFDPDEKTLATVAQVKKVAPVNLDELDKKRP